MTKPDLSEARAKLDRARKHIADFEALISNFLATDFYRLRIETDERKGRMELVFESLHQPNKELNVVLGDAIGNLRSTLDYAAVAIARPITGAVDGVYFPFADQANGFAGQCRNPNLGLSETLRSHFIDNVQAYEGGNGHTLWAVNKIRNIDKHRFLVATVEVAGFIASWRTATGVYNDCGIGVRAGKRTNAFSTNIGNLQFTKQPTPTFDVRLSEPAIGKEVPLPHFLQDAARATKAVLDGLDIAFEGNA